MLVKDVTIHKPLVLNAHGTDPGHAGCVVNGDKWEFRASTTNEFNNGIVVLDSVYASGSFYRENPRFDPNTPRMFDLQSKLALSEGSITGEQFYNVIPAAYRYQDHFSSYLKVSIVLGIVCFICSLPPMLSRQFTRLLMRAPGVRRRTLHASRSPQVLPTSMEKATQSTLVFWTVLPSVVWLCSSTSILSLSILLASSYL